MNSTASPASVISAVTRPEKKARPAFAARETASVVLHLDGDAHDLRPQARQLRDEWRRRRYSRLKP